MNVVEDDEPNCNFVDEHDAIDITESDDGQFSCRVPAPADLHAVVIGKGRATLQKLEKETGTSISVPRKGQGVHEITISGPSESSVSAARTRITILLDSARGRADYTHFLNVPLNTPEMITSMRKFQQNLLSDCVGAAGMSPELLVEPARLHLTLTMLKLLTPEECDHASATLQGCAPGVSALLSGPLNLVLVGLEYMNDDPQAVDVLYAKVEGEGSEVVHRISEHIIQSFIEAGLLGQEEVARQRLLSDDGASNIKLHATLVNSKYRKGRGGKGGKANDTREPFDASTMLDLHSDMPIGSMTVTSIAISAMTGSAHNGGYKHISALRV